MNGSYNNMENMPGELIMKHVEFKVINATLFIDSETSCGANI